jgi:hypothetical protein
LLPCVEGFENDNEGGARVAPASPPPSTAVALLNLGRSIFNRNLAPDQPSTMNVVPMTKNNKGSWTELICNEAYCDWARSLEPTAWGEQLIEWSWPPLWYVHMAFTDQARFWTLDQRRFSASSSSSVRGQSAPSSLDRARSASTLPPVWHFAQ